MNAVIDVEQFQNENPASPLPAALRFKLRRAKQMYSGDAQGDTIAEYIRVHRQLQRMRGIGWISDLTRIYEANYNSRGNFATARFYPRYSTWFDETLNWTRITISNSDLETRTHNSQSSVSGGLSASWGMFSIGGRYSSEESRKWRQSEINGLSISTEILAVQIQYPCCLLYTSPSPRDRG